MPGRNPALILILNACIAFSSPVPSAAEDVDDSGYTLLLAFPSQLSKDDVSRVAVEAFTNREWTVKSASEDRVVGYLHHKGIDATLEFRILDDRIVYSCECVKERKRKGASKTARARRTVDWTPVGWIENLRSDIQNDLRLNSTTVRATQRRRSVSKENQSSIGERLRELNELLAQGLVSQEEYGAKRAEILSEL